MLYTEIFHFFLSLQILQSLISAGSAPTISDYFAAPAISAVPAIHHLQTLHLQFQNFYRPLGLPIAHTLPTIYSPSLPHDLCSPSPISLTCYQPFSTCSFIPACRPSSWPAYLTTHRLPTYRTPSPAPQLTPRHTPFPATAIICCLTHATLLPLRSTITLP